MTFDQAPAGPAMAHRPPGRDDEVAGHQPTDHGSQSKAGTVHDLGNFIQLASSAVAILSRSPDLRGGNLASLVASAKMSLDRAGALVRQALGHAWQRSEASPTASLADCVAEVQAVICGVGPSDLSFDVRLEPDLPRLSCDPLGLQCALLNLVFNARDAMAGHGVIRLRGRRDAREAVPLLELEVIDTGIGMTPETVARAFDPFFTTKCDGLGGIGLPMVERFAREWGGEIVIESEPGFGTTVTLRLPVAAAPVPCPPTSIPME
ncbi:sensor histidine kinase [Sphingosinicella sp. CPCC 101087]|uniref:sensor histidine kinase n=1 Tax=Sphingosinicella sp. CPCC 101087 TaxID=2497754 RepID=UPI00101CF2DA|nr:ATP-binding protein [Sphingosinicella sp. CPCC 101087]